MGKRCQVNFIIQNTNIMCTITIDQPTIVISGSTITSITVTGTIEPISECSCETLRIRISCAHASFSNIQSVPIAWVGSQGTFSATFTGSDLNNCHCDGNITALVDCQNMPTTTQTFQINCNACDDLSVSSLPGSLCVGDSFQFQVAYTGGGI